MNKKYSILRPKLLSASIAAALSVVGSSVFVAPLYAQDSEEIEEVIVTGSRIVRRDYESNSPIMTIDQDLIENTSTVGIESVLNQLPQFVPAITQFDTAEVQVTATTTAGASTVSLRGLGANRNLVILDGRRAMPVNAGMAVDVNSIPSSAIARVETITGGASSVYGADAMAGVVNFVLKKDFEGVDLDMQTSMTEQGDGQETRIGLLFGANFADGRGNVMFGAEYADRDKIRDVDRDFSRDGFADVTVGGTGVTGTYVSNNAFNNGFSQSVLDSIFSESTPGSVGGDIYVNTNDSVYTTTPAGAYRFSDIDGGETGAVQIDPESGAVFRKIDDNGDLQENLLSSMISIPLERYSLFGRGHFDLSDNLTVFAQGNFANSSTETLLGFSPAVGPWGTLIPHGSDIYSDSLNADGVTTSGAYLAGGLHGLDCPATGGCTNSQAFPTPNELTQLLDSRANPNADWTLNRSLDFIGARRTANDSTTYQVTGGLQGNLETIDGTWEVYASYGSTLGQTQMRGFGSVERWRTIASSPNYGQGFYYEGNAEVGNNFGGGIGQCDSGLPIFGDAPIDQGCIDLIHAQLQNTQKMEQTIVEANFQGRLIDLPAGEARFALGASYRENIYSFQTDILTSQDSFLDSAVGLFPAANSYGEVDVTELYGELLLPVISNVPLIEELTLELGYRISDNSSVGNVDTWKALIDWGITDYARFRGGYQLANRAPNIAELFQSRTQGLDFHFEGDVCSLVNRAGTDQGVLDLCIEMMGITGAQSFYDPARTQTGAPGEFTWAFKNVVGNPLVQEETADTITAGFVISSPWDNEWLESTSMTIDYYSIEITDMISEQSPADVYNRCFDAELNPNFDINFAPCQLVSRNPANGFSAPTDVTYSNAARVKTEGVDLAVNWSHDLFDGTLAINFQSSFLISMETQTTPESPVREWKGTNGPDNSVSGLNGGSYDFRTFTTFSYMQGPMSLSARWRYLPDIDSSDVVTSPNPQILSPGSYNMIDVSGSWVFGDNYILRAGIDNLFDKAPPITGAVDLNVDPNGTSGAGTTSAGFYDVLGRRYYVGLKVSF